MIWDFLSDANNQKTLSFLGGGIVVAISGLWTAFLFFRKKPDPPKPKPTPTNAISSGDGFAAMGDVLVEGDVTITKTQVPKSLYILAALGCGLLALGVALPRCGDSVTTNSVTACGDLNAGDITIGAPQKVSE